MPSDNQKSVLGELLNQATPLAKIIISAYSPDVKYETNMANIRRYDAAHIEAAAAFLGFRVRADEKKLYKNLKVLSDRVILKIESLFESSCTECGEKYCNKLSDVPLITCYLCLQGCHNCDKVTEKAPARTKSPGGSVWLCFGCLKKNDLALVPKLNSTKPPTNKIKSADNKDRGEDDEEEDEEDRVSPRRNREPSLKAGPVCEAYKKRECPHGLTGKRLVDCKACPFRHPPRYFRWCQHGENSKRGCTRGKECKYFHPRLCQSSVAKRMCQREDCKYIHLKGTRRPKTADVRNRNDKRPRLVSESDGFMRRGFSLNSLSTCVDSPGPHQPTIQKRETNKISKKQKAADREEDPNSFLYMLMENMKEGLQSQIAVMRTEMLATLPQLVREQMNRQSASHQQFIPQMQGQMLQCPPLNQNPIPASLLQAPVFQPQFPGFSY